MEGGVGTRTLLPLDRFQDHAPQRFSFRAFSRERSPLVVGKKSVSKGSLSSHFSRKRGVGYREGPQEAPW